MIKITYNFKDTVNIATKYCCRKDKYWLRYKFEEQFPKLKLLKDKKEIILFFEKEYKKLESNINIEERIKEIRDFFNKNQYFLENNLFKIMGYPVFDVEIRIGLLPIYPYGKNKFYLSVLGKDYSGCIDYLYLHETSHMIWHKCEEDILKKLKINRKKYFRALHDIKEIFASVIINQNIFKKVLKKRLEFLKKFRNLDFDKDYGNYYENYFIKNKDKVINIVDYFMDFYKRNKDKGFLYVQKESIKKIINKNKELENKFEIIKKQNELNDNKYMIDKLRKEMVLD